MNNTNKKIIIGVVAILVVIGIVLSFLGDSGKDVVGDKEIDLSGVEVPNKGDDVVENSNYEEIAVPRDQGKAGSVSGNRPNASVRFYDVTFENNEISPKTFIINKKDSVRFRIKSLDNQEYNFTIEKFAQSKNIPADGSEINIRFSAYFVGEFPIICSNCKDGGKEVGTFVVTPEND